MVFTLSAKQTFIYIYLAFQFYEFFPFLLHIPCKYLCNTLAIYCSVFVIHATKFGHMQQTLFVKERFDELHYIAESEF